jgi:hypothetical protein
MAIRIASSASLTDVQSAVTAASDGDIVLIPNGTVTWTGGITTTKQIIIRAQNYTPTPAGVQGSGATSRNVTITNNSASGYLFSFTSGNNYHCGLGGIRFNEGTGEAGFVAAAGSGSKVFLLFDCYFDVNVRMWPLNHAIDIQSVGAVCWNTLIVGDLGNNPSDQPGEGAVLVKSSRAWTTASTMGAADTDGNINVYFEDSSFTNMGLLADMDDNARLVVRYSKYDGAWGETHGFTSTWGGRHWEYYNNEFRITTPQRNLAGRYFWCRAGTGIFTENAVYENSYTSDFGTMVLLNIGDNTLPQGSYPINRQPGGGHNGSNYLIDPIYIWNNTQAKAQAWSVNTDWQSVVQADRDVFVSGSPGTAKPGYSKYTYPHPFRSVRIYADSNSAADVQAAIDVAVDGDTVVIPSGNPTWSTTVTVDKGITLEGGGSYSVNGSHNDTGTWPLTINLNVGTNNGISIDVTTGTKVRVTGIYFTGTAAYGETGAGCIGIATSNTTPWRVDNCKFNATQATSIACQCSGRGGLIDHIYVYQSGCSPNNYIVIRDVRNDFSGGWALSQAFSWGSSGFVFVEDSTFWQNTADGSATPSVIDAQAGGKFVFRHNYLYNAMVTWHGSESSAPERGGYAFEIYDNVFYWSRTDWLYGNAIFDRGGSCLIYNNTVTNYTKLWTTWEKRATDVCGVFGQADGTKAWDGNYGGAYPTGYPIMDQTGRGAASGYGYNGSYEPQNVQPQAQSKCYLWNNTLNNTGLVGSNNPTYVVEGRDYELSALSGYSAYTYPHPLQSSGGGGGGGGEATPGNYVSVRFN